MERIGTPERPLYFLHIPKTGGSSLTRLLEDAFPADAIWPSQHVAELDAASDEELRGHALYFGHHGLALPLRLDRRPAIVTLLRDPAARAWSQFRAQRPAALTFDDFSRGRGPQTAGPDHQAKWLTGRPYGDQVHTFGDVDDLAADELARRALATLDTLALAGTLERADDFVEALARLLGRWLPRLPHVNAGDGSGAEPAAPSPVDERVIAAADARLDAALATLPPVPPEPRAVLPVTWSMDGPLAGDGWHGRMTTADAGWHRWTGPGTRATVRLPVRHAGRATLRVAIVSAAGDDVVRSLRIDVQDRPVAHRLEPARVGVVAVADVHVDPHRPLVFALEVAGARPLAPGDAPAGLAVGDITLAPHTG